MANMTITLAKRLRAHAVSHLITPTQHAVFSNLLNVDAMKQRTADWEPTLPFSRFKTDSEPMDDDENGVNVAQMVTYSASDPGATHPLLLSSALPILNSSLAENTSTTSTLGRDVKTGRSSAAATPPKRTTSTTATTLHHAIEVQQIASVAHGEKSKPWPYSPSNSLQPKTGAYGDSNGVMDKVKVEMLQQVLYDIPEPEEVKEESESEKKELRRKVLHGSQEGEEEEVKAGC